MKMLAMDFSWMLDWEGSVVEVKRAGAADDDDDVVLLTLRPCWLSAAGVAGPCGSRPWAAERQLREGSVTSRS